MRRAPLFLSTLFLLFSCQEEKINIPLLHLDCAIYQYEAKEDYLVYKLNSDTFKQMVTLKLSFPLYVYASGCGGCSNFSLCLKDYIRLNSVIFPFITLQNFYITDLDKPTFTESALLFYEDGELKKYYDDIDTRVASSEDLDAIMSEYCYSSSLTYCSLAKIETAPSATFSSYQLYPSVCASTEADFTPIIADLKTVRKAIVIRNTNYIPFAIKKAEELMADSLYVSSDNSSAFSSFFGFTPREDMYLAEYENGELVEASSLTLDLV